VQRELHPSCPRRLSRVATVSGGEWYACWSVSGSEVEEEGRGGVSCGFPGTSDELLVLVVTLAHSLLHRGEAIIGTTHKLYIPIEAHGAYKLVDVCGNGRLHTTARPDGQDLACEEREKSGGWERARTIGFRL
jgi:hypothetical protein